MMTIASFSSYSSSFFQTTCFVSVCCVACHYMRAIYLCACLCPALGMSYVDLLLGQRGKSALQVWGIVHGDKDDFAVVEDEDKEAFRTHVDVIFADVL